MNEKLIENLITETHVHQIEVANLLEAFILDKNINQVAEDYLEHKTKKIDYGFNIFEIVTDLYYREKFHSDLIAAFLNPFEKHYEGNLFLNIFIEYINQIKPKLSINSLEFKNSEVITEFFIKSEGYYEKEENNATEKGYIDILIKSVSHKKVIIIENKINNAPDQKNQLPKYAKYFLDNEYQIEAIIYLNLNHRKKPDTTTWTKDKEILKIIDDKLRIVEAYNETNNNDLLKNWLVPCQLKAKNFDAIAILKQYSKLIQKLGFQNMNQLIMDKFYPNIQNKEKYETALAIRNMLNDLPKYTRRRIEQNYESNYKPFEKIWLYEAKDGNAVVFEGSIYNTSKSRLVLHINVPSDLKVDLEFFERLNIENNREIATTKEVLKQINLLDSFTLTGDNRFKYNTVFNLPYEENELYEIVNSFLEKLRKLP